jgi:hypothetical protein
MNVGVGMAISWRRLARGALLFHCTLITWTAVLFAPSTAEASEVSVEECVSAHEESQVNQAQGRLLEARKTLLLCSNEACPSVVRSDCASWYTRNNGDIPSLIFAARKGEDDLPDARIFVNGELLGNALDGREKEFNPGRYTVRIERGEMRTRDNQCVRAKANEEVNLRYW